MGATRDIIARAMKDEAFRNSLLKDPKSTIQKEYDVNLPEGVTVQVHENSPDVIHLVLPGPLNLTTDRPLSDQELQQVAGGVLSGATFGTVTKCCKATSSWTMCPKTSSSCY